MRLWESFPTEVKSEIINSCAQSQLCIAARVLPSLRKYVLGFLPRISKEASHLSCLVKDLVMLPVPGGGTADGSADGIRLLAEPARGSHVPPSSTEGLSLQLWNRALTPALVCLL